MTDKAPIFIARARSFWWTVLSIFLAFSSAGLETFQSAVALVAPVFGIQLDAAVEWAGIVYPILPFLAVLIERRGSNRPYTWRVNRETVS